MLSMDEIKDNFPFLSIIKTNTAEYVGIIQNHDDKIMTFYDFDAIKTSEEKKLFLEYGDIWWWESNRLLPIYIFLTGEMRHFRYCMKTITMKEATVLHGPITSLHNLQKKRIKKRQIQLIKKSED